jgi:hypothetical protein
MDDLVRVYPAGVGGGSSPAPDAAPVDHLAREVLLMHLIALASDEASWTRLLACVLKAAVPSATPAPSSEGGAAAAASPEALVTLQRLYVSLLPPPGLTASPLLFGYVAACAASGAKVLVSPLVFWWRVHGCCSLHVG